jgi:hypothetical protein
MMIIIVLNNLLENREMQLDDGRFLVAPKRYAKLVADSKHKTLPPPSASTMGSGSNTIKVGDQTVHQLVPVHANFRVIAIGVPVPPFPGNPLDPPLRSRFQVPPSAF